MKKNTSKKQLKVYHPDSSHPVGIQPDALDHYISMGWSTEKPKLKPKSNPKPKTETVEKLNPATKEN